MKQFTALRIILTQSILLLLFSTQFQFDIAIFILPIHPNVLIWESHWCWFRISISSLKSYLLSDNILRVPDRSYKFCEKRPCQGRKHFLKIQISYCDLVTWKMKIQHKYFLGEGGQRILLIFYCLISPSTNSVENKVIYVCRLICCPLLNPFFVAV